MYFTNRFEDLYIDVITPKTNLFLPSGFIHAVITLDHSAMLTLDLVREDWLEFAEKAFPNQVECFREMVRQRRDTTDLDTKVLLDENIKIIRDRCRADVFMLEMLEATKGIGTANVSRVQEIIRLWRAEIMASKTK